jgi:predicted alpha/beta hydrolase family esterase
MSSTRGLVISAPARRVFGAVQGVSPSFAARLAERWFFTPPRRSLTTEGLAFLRSGRRFTLLAGQRSVVGWTWGAGPTVYLMHGWGGRAASWYTFARSLIEIGHSVVTFDAPGHGESGRGRTSMPEFARALLAVAQRFGPARAVIAHSFGAGAVVLAARWGLKMDRVALLAPVADPSTFADAFAAALEASPDVMARLRAISERRLRMRWTEVNVCAAAPHMSAPLLVVHDWSDDVVPFSEGAAIAAAWPSARLFSTSGLGHRGVMRDPRVVAEVTQFVANAETRPWPSGQMAELEQELFDRRRRWR